ITSSKNYGGHPGIAAEASKRLLGLLINWVVSPTISRFEGMLFQSSKVVMISVYNFVKKQHRRICSIMLISSSIFVSLGQTDSLAQVEIWERTDLKLVSSENYANPFLDVTVDAVFTHESGAVITLPGYWDGGN